VCYQVVTMRLKAPAKINLSLRVLKKRDDGYHLIETLMVPVSLYDELIITRGRNAKKQITVTTDHPELPIGNKNLVHKAASLLLRETHIKEPISLHIKKNIPIGAGLGGGSSDAAATLIGLNSVFKLGYKDRELCRLGSRLGADVPFFIFSRPARATGIGDRIKIIDSFPKLWLILLYPGFEVSTRWAYRSLENALTKQVGNTSIISSLKGFRNLRLVNDLEKVTIPRYPKIASLKEKLTLAGARGTLMSGSGSAVFGIFTGKKSAIQAFRRLKKNKCFEAYLVHTIS